MLKTILLSTREGRTSETAKLRLTYMVKVKKKQVIRRQRFLNGEVLNAIYQKLLGQRVIGEVRSISNEIL